MPKINLGILIGLLFWIATFPQVALAAEVTKSAEDTAKATITEYAIFVNPRRYRRGANVYAVRVDGKTVRRGEQLLLEPGRHRVAMKYDGERSKFRVNVEFDLEAGQIYRPRAARVDTKGLEFIVVRIENVETKGIVVESRPYLPRYSRRSINPPQY